MSGGKQEIYGGDMRRWMTPTQTLSLKHRSSISWLVGLVMMGVAVLASIWDLLPDVVTTVLGILGCAGLVYGVATGIQVLLDREPDE